MKRFTFRLRYLVIALLVSVLLFGGAAYLLENWTGAEALAAARARVTAAGETLDFRELLPEIPPAEENLGAIPQLERITLRGVSHPELKKLEWTCPTKWVRPKLAALDSAERTDLAAWCRFLSGTKNLSIAPNASATELLAALDVEYPVVKAVSDAAPGKLSCVFLPSIGDSVKFDWVSAHCPHYQYVQSLAHALILRASAAVSAGQPEEAVRSLQAVYLLARGLGEEPTDRGLRMAVSFHYMSFSPLRELLALPGVTQAQRDALTVSLVKIDLLASVMKSIRGELAVARDITNQSSMELVLSHLAYRYNVRDWVEPWMTGLLPQGFLDHSAAKLMDRQLQALQLFAKRDNSHLKAVAWIADADRARGEGVLHAHYAFQRLITQHAYFSDILIHSQVLQAQAIWHLRGAQLPLPTDPITGQAMKGDAAKLWSVGPDEVDDGGKTVAKVKAGSLGDWPWVALKTGQ
jgi:hypothetical protein